MKLTSETVGVFASYSFKSAGEYFKVFKAHLHGYIKNGVLRFPKKFNRFLYSKFMQVFVHTLSCIMFKRLAEVIGMQIEHCRKPFTRKLVVVIIVQIDDRLQYFRFELR